MHNMEMEAYFWKLSWTAIRLVFLRKYMNYLFTGMELFEGEGKQGKVSLSGIAKIFLIIALMIGIMMNTKSV